ncbi:MAG: phosphatase PAP2 family protein [Myxococcota bacterium]
MLAHVCPGDTHRTIHCRLLGVFILSSLVLVPNVGHGQPDVDASLEAETDDGIHSPYEVNLAVDIPLTVGLFATSTMLVNSRPDTVAPSCYPCSAEPLNSLDATVVGNDSSTGRTISDWGLYASMAAPYAVGFVDALASDHAGAWKGFLVDSLVVTEAMAAAMTINQIFKMTAQRPRPSVYADHSNPQRISYGDSLSFYSGHTSMAFAGAVATARTWSLRHPESEAKPAMWSACLALAVATGVGRVAGGKHFWSDVLVGAVAGSAAGWLVPTFHLKDGDRVAANDTRVQFMPTGLRVDF